MKLVIALVLLVLGSLLFHWWSPWWMTPIASNWVAIDDTIELTLYTVSYTHLTLPTNREV